MCGVRAIPNQQRTTPVTFVSNAFVCQPFVMERLVLLRSQYF